MVQGSLLSLVELLGESVSESRCAQLRIVLEEVAFWPVVSLDTQWQSW